MYWREIIRELRALLESSDKSHGKQQKFDRLMLYLKNSPYLHKNKNQIDGRFFNQILEPRREKKTKTGLSYLPHAVLGKDGIKKLETGELRPAVKKNRQHIRFRKAKRKYKVKVKRFLDNSPVIEEVRDSGAYFNKLYRIVTAEEKREAKDDPK